MMLSLNRPPASRVEGLLTVLDQTAAVTTRSHHEAAFGVHQPVVRKALHVHPPRSTPATSSSSLAEPGAITRLAQSGSGDCSRPIDA